MIPNCPKCEELNKGEWVDDWDLCPECLVEFNVESGQYSIRYLEEIIDNEDEN